MEHAPRSAKARLLDAALQIMRTRGYAATTVDDLCATAGVTKGGFFHHFKSKEAMTLAAVAQWNSSTGEIFAQAPYHALPDPRDRVLAYIDFRQQLLQGAPAEFSCLLGTLLQETFDSHPRLREACRDGIGLQADPLAQDIAAAKALYVPDALWEPQVLALFTQATLQGAFILAKGQGSANIVAACMVHLRQHVANLLGAPSRPNLN